MTMRGYDTNLHFYLFCIRICTLPDVLGIIGSFLFTFFFFLRELVKPHLKGLHVFFYKQHFYKQHQAEIGKNLSKSYATL